VTGAGYACALALHSESSLLINTLNTVLMT